MYSPHKNKLVVSIYILLSWVVVLIDSYTPVGRYGQSSVLVGDKIYHFGGEQLPQANISAALDEVLYLDLSTPFNIKSPSWINITPKSQIPFANSLSTAVSHLNDNGTYIIYLIGGIMVDVKTDEDKFSSFVHVFNTDSNEWATSTTEGEPERRFELSSVIDKSNKIRIFGGVTNKDTGSPITKWFTDQYVLDLETMVWTSSIGSDVPTQRFDYSTTLLPNGLIICIGGWEIPLGDKERFIEMNQIYIYDTNINKWDLKFASGAKNIDARRFHTASLTDDGRIIVFGGENVVHGSAQPSLVVLDTNDGRTFTWILPFISEEPYASPLPLMLHSASIINDYMVVTFGNVTDGREKLNDRVYLFDVMNYQWINEYIINSSFSPMSRSKPKKALGKSPSNKQTDDPETDEPRYLITIISTCIGSLAFGVIITAIITYIYKKHKRIMRDHKELH
ncbi:11070_t:CDS:2 [Funneliformis geosporum]|uniref:11070_t:CDS:1 n=1 Tax=Funneliformis geosporum TaxID=1117311 RepID=A0A9W4WZF0_9GLOM|nr:11070_t:CDS:2 [Funneliformis geosporum]